MDRELATTELIQVNIEGSPCPGKSRIPRVITIAGSDPSGGAGIEADLKTITSLGCYGMTCIDAITIQNTMGVIGKEVTDFDSLDAIMTANFTDDMIIDVIKVGMMTEEVTEWFRRRYSQYHGKYLVVDPIISSSSGYSLAKKKLVRQAALYVYPKATLLTPNYMEALKIMEILGCDKSKYSGHDLDHCIQLATDLASLTRCRAVLLKGGHIPPIEGKEEVVIDTLYDSRSSKTTIFEHPRITGSKNTHGTGCTLSSAIASYLGLGCNLEEAIRGATCYLHNSMRFADNTLGKGAGPLNHIYNIKGHD